MSDAVNDMALAPWPALMRDEAAGVRLPHLGGPSACVRQVLAAHFLRGLPHIVEIGGAGLPISAFVTHQPRSVTVIDPKIEDLAAETLNGAPCRVRHIAAKFQAVDLTHLEGDYGLVLLGLSLKPLGRRPAVDEGLVHLAGGAAVVVLDYAVELERAQAQWPLLLPHATHDAHVDLAIRLNDPHVAGSGYAERRFLVLTRREPAIPRGQNE